MPTLDITGEFAFIDAIERACIQLANLPLDVAIVSHQSPSPTVTALVDRIER